MSLLLESHAKQKQLVKDYTDAIVEFGGKPRFLFISPRHSIPDALPKIDGLLLPGGEHQSSPLAMNLGIMLEVLARLKALASRAMRWRYTSANRHSKPIYLFRNLPAGFR